MQSKGDGKASTQQVSHPISYKRKACIISSTKILQVFVFYKDTHGLVIGSFYRGKTVDHRLARKLTL